MTSPRPCPILQPMPTPEDHIAGLTALIAAQEGVRRVILFGSRARGDAAPRADIDLAVEGDDRVDWTGLWLAVEDYPTLLQIDLVPLHTVDDAFADRVRREGRVLNARP
jgi:uncharacterized protein